MADEFDRVVKAAAPVRIKKRPFDKRKLFGLLFFIILFLSFAGTVPLDSVPGINYIVTLLGFPTMENRGITLAKLIAGGGPGNRFNYSSYGYGDKSLLSSAMGSINPVDVNEYRRSRLLDAKNARRNTLFRGISGVAKNPEGVDRNSQYYIANLNKFKSGQAGFEKGDIALATQDMGEPSKSAFKKPDNAQDFTLHTPKEGENAAAISKELGVSNVGRIGQFVDKKGRYRRGRSLLGVHDMGEDPFGQAGTSWLFSRAGERSKISESKKLLATAAFDGSVLPEEVILKQGETGTSVDAGAVANDINSLNAQQMRNQICAQARAYYNPLINQSRTALDKYLTEFQAVPIPQCGPGYCTKTAGRWQGRVNELYKECLNYNSHVEALAASCSLKVKEGTGDCSKITNYGKLEGCHRFDDLFCNSRTNNTKKRQTAETLVSTRANASVGGALAETQISRQNK